MIKLDQQMALDRLLCHFVAVVVAQEPALFKSQRLHFFVMCFHISHKTLHVVNRCTAENKRVKDQLEATERGAPRLFPADDGPTTDVEENASYISRVCQRVQEGDIIWALMDFEIDNPDSSDPPKRYQKWKRFESEAELKDYVRRDTGEPLMLPPFSLSPDQSLEIQQQAKKEVSQVTEEFRRFRVRSEVQRKQIDAHVRDLQNNNVQTAKRRIEGEDLVRFVAWYSSYVLHQGPRFQFEICILTIPIRTGKGAGTSSSGPCTAGVAQK